MSMTRLVEAVMLLEGIGVRGEKELTYPVFLYVTQEWSFSATTTRMSSCGLCVMFVWLVC